MSNRRRQSTTVGLMALLLGALGAGSVSFAAEVVVAPAVVGGIALPDRFVLTDLAEVRAGEPAVKSGAEPVDPAAPPATTTEAPPTTTEPPVTTTTEPPTTTPPPRTSSRTQPPPAPAPPAGQAEQVVALVNTARAAAGCPAVGVDQRLVASAQGHSSDMASKGYFSHTSQDGRTFADRIRAAGYPSPAAENIAMGQRSAEQVMDAWMKSSGHRANILNCGIKNIGVGLDTRGWYWTQNFGR